MIGAEDEKIAELARAGKGCAVIAAVLGLYPSQVQGRLSVLARAGLIPRKTGGAVPAKVPRRIGPPLLDTRPATTVPSGPDRDHIRAVIRAEYAKPDGMQTPEIAAHLGITERQVRSHAGLMSIKRHPDWVGQRQLSSGETRTVAPPRPRPAGHVRSFERLSRQDLGPGAPAAGHWPEGAPRFTDVPQLYLLREMVVPAFRRWPGPVTRQTVTGCALAGHR